MSGRKEHVLDALYATIDGRRDADPEDSWTARLLAGGVPKIARKTGEEAIETVVAALAEGPEALVAESADLLYHLLVLWSVRGVTPDMVWTELQQRKRVSGLDEKASRKPR